MQNDNKPEPNKRTVNDVAGVGEASKAFFEFFGKIIDKLPFDKMSAAQTQFIIIFCVINLMTIIALLVRIAPAMLLYVVIGYDMIMAFLSFKLHNAKKRR